MSRQAVRWLYGELPALVRDGLLSEDSARRLRERYGDAAARSGRALAIAVCSIFGGLLVGAGVILVLAHNWEQLSRPARAGLSLAPLLLAQAAALWSVSTGRSVAWREGIGAFLVMAVGASIALVSQTYHIGGDLGGFLFTCALLTWPLPYLLDAGVPCMLYLGGVTVWSGYERSCGEQALWFWVLAGLAVPFIWREWRLRPYSLRASWLGWAASLCLVIALGITLEKAVPGLWIVIYAALFAILYLVGGFWFHASESAFRRPFHAVGAVGACVLALLLTFEWPWDDIGWSHYRWDHGSERLGEIVDYVMAALLPAGAIVLAVTAVRRRLTGRLLIGVLPVVAIAGYGLASLLGDEAPAVLLFDAYVFALGVGLFATGIRQSRLGIVNGGMLVLAALIVARFFDSDFGFLSRGLAFIAVGVGFLGTNGVLVRRWKREAA